MTSSKGYLRPSCARPLGGPRIHSVALASPRLAAFRLGTYSASAWHLPGTCLVLAWHLLRGTTTSSLRGPTGLLISGLACIPQLPALVLVRLLRMHLLLGLRSKCLLLVSGCVVDRAGRQGTGVTWVVVWWFAAASFFLVFVRGVAWFHARHSASIDVPPHAMGTS